MPRPEAAGTSPARAGTDHGDSVDAEGPDRVARQPSANSEATPDTSSTRAKRDVGHGSRPARRSSQCVERLLVLTRPPRLDAGRITDKGCVNQAAVRDRRADLVALLTADPPPDEVIAR